MHCVSAILKPCGFRAAFSLVAARFSATQTASRLSSEFSRSARASNDSFGAVLASRRRQAERRLARGDGARSLERSSEREREFAAPDNIEAQFKALEAGGVDDELAALKKSLPGASSKGALPEGRPVSEAIESELEALRKSRDDA